MVHSLHPVFCFNWPNQREADSGFINEIPTSFKLLSTYHSNSITSLPTILLSTTEKSPLCFIASIVILFVLKIIIWFCCMEFVPLADFESLLSSVNFVL